MNIDKEEQARIEAAERDRMAQEDQDSFIDEYCNGIMPPTDTEEARAKQWDTCKRSQTDVDNSIRYFKVVNPFGHHGLVYKDGINVDPIPFNPTGSCRPGGIYFSSKDILAFSDYGPYMYEVWPIGQIYKEVDDRSQNSPIVKYKAHALKMKNLGRWSSPRVLEILSKAGVDFKTCNCVIFLHCCILGHMKAVKYLIEHQGMNPNESKSNEGAPLSRACQCGHMDIVKYLIKKGAIVDVTALNLALSNNHYKIARYLIDNGSDIAQIDTNEVYTIVYRNELSLLKYMVSKGLDLGNMIAKFPVLPHHRSPMHKYLMSFVKSDKIKVTFKETKD